MAATRAQSQSALSNYQPLRSAHAAVTIAPLLGGVDGTFQTLAAMAQAVRGEIPPDFSGYSDSYNAAAASSITGGSMGDVAALLRYCRDAITYIDHPFNMQVVKDCRRTLESNSGDCVSKSVCLATLLACCGIESRFVAQASDGANYDHVYVQAYIDGQWVSLDPTADGHEGRPLGDIGWSQALPEGAGEMPYTIFFSIPWGEPK